MKEKPCDYYSQIIIEDAKPMRESSRAEVMVRNRWEMEVEGEPRWSMVEFKKKRMEKQNRPRTGRGNPKERGK